VATRTAKRSIISRRAAIAAAAMVLIAFALGFFVHPL